MVNWEVTIGGTPVEAVSTVEPTEGDEGKLGTCKVVCGATATNRGFESGQDATVKRNGVVEFTGRVTKAPSAGRTAEQLEYTLSDSRVELRYIEAHRPFYQMDTGDIIKEAVLQESTVKSPVTIHEGSTTTGVESDAPEFELLNSDQRRLNETGSDLIFAGWPSGTSGTYYVRFDVPSEGVPGDGQIIRLATRLLLNNRGDQIEVEIDLRDAAGNNYVWQVDNLSTNFQEITLAAEDAEPDATIGSLTSQDSTLEYRFDLKGDLPEPRGVALDSASVLPFTLTSRSPDVTTNSVETTGNVITRRFDENVMQMLKILGDEDGYDSWVDDSDDLHYEPASGRQASVQITDTSPVTDYSFNRDYDGIVNKVTVQGKDDISVTAVDNGSVQFYGISEREEQIVDKEIQTQEEADRKAREYLDDNAWSDTAISFELADIEYADASVGEAMRVQWSPEDVDTFYTVNNKEIDSQGFVTLQFTGSTASGG